jgi:hypothetical protein
LLLTLQQAADLAGITLAQIRVKIALGELTPESLGTSVTTRETTYLFSEDDIVQLKTLMLVPSKNNGNAFVDDGSQTDFTVKQVASMWQLP